MPAKKLHGASGLCLATFTGLHLFNHLFSIYGPEEHINLMHSLRVFYRNTFIEALLLLSVLVQVITGLQLLCDGRKKATGFFEKLQRFTGGYLALFLIVHVAAVLWGRQSLGIDTNIYFGAAGINIFPVNLFFIPYYALAVFSVFGHFAALHARKMRITICKLTPNQQGDVIIFIGIVFSCAILYGLTGGFDVMEIPEPYNTLF